MIGVFGKTGNVGESMPAELTHAYFSFLVDATIDETTVHPTVRQVLGREPRPSAEWVAHDGRFR